MTPGTEEVEWQFDAPDIASVARWLREGLPAHTRAVPREPARLLDTYYDTPDWRLYHAGVACRIRRKGAAAELTLKTMADAIDGVRTRTEVNETLSGGFSDPRQAPGPAGDAVRALVEGEPLRELFMLQTDRQVYDVVQGGIDIGEVALDTTIVCSVAADGQLLRVEVEVPHVDRARPFVDALVAANGLVPAAISKFETGLDAARPA